MDDELTRVSSVASIRDVMDQFGDDYIHALRGFETRLREEIRRVARRQVFEFAVVVAVLNIQMLLLLKLA